MAELVEKPCFCCPRHCGAVRPLSAEGRDLKTLPGVCKSALLPSLARAALHYWEEPVISGKNGSGTVFFSGCNLHCVFCQNYNVSSRHQGKEVSVSRLKEIYRELIAQGANNINFVTPAHYTDAILASLEEKLPVPTVYNTNGYDDVDNLRRLEGKIDVYLPDMKYMDNAVARRYSGVPDYVECAQSAIAEMFRQTGPFVIGEDGLLKRGVIIRHLILPGMVENSLKVVRWVAENFRKGDVLFSLMRQYLPCGQVSAAQYPELNRRVTFREYKRVRDALFAAGIEDGFLQDAQSAQQAYVPEFDGTGV